MVALKAFAKTFFQAGVSGKVLAINRSDRAVKSAKSP
jgi:hypothetical protein